MPQELEVLLEIRDLLQVIAEPALSERDKKLRTSLRSVVGSSDKRARAVQLMDGSESQSAIAKEAGLDAGNVSRLAKALAAERLSSSDEKCPRLLLRIPHTFFDTEGVDE